MRQRINTIGLGIGAVVAALAIAFALAVGVGAVTLPGSEAQGAAIGNLLANTSNAGPDWTGGTRGPGWGDGGMHGGYGPLGALVAAGTITSDQATKIALAVRAEHQKTEQAGGQEDATTWQKDVQAALDGLVAAGTITSDQATKVKTALATMPMGPGFGGRGHGGWMHGGWGPTGPKGTYPGASSAPTSANGTTS
jgi:polyhydroxyalkanoate synthesis regulator phasin